MKDQNPLSADNHYFRKCLKGHADYSISFDECPSCKVERNRPSKTNLDPSLLMDNAATASQCQELLDDHPTRQAVLLNVYRPLWDEIERLRQDVQSYEAVLRGEQGVMLEDGTSWIGQPFETSEASHFDLGSTTAWKTYQYWEHDAGPGKVTCHSRVVDGVLCRWWGDGPVPEGVSMIDRAAQKTQAGTTCNCHIGCGNHVAPNNCPAHRKMIIAQQQSVLNTEKATEE